MCACVSATLKPPRRIPTRSDVFLPTRSISSPSFLHMHPCIPGHLVYARGRHRVSSTSRDHLLSMLLRIDELEETFRISVFRTFEHVDSLATKFAQQWIDRRIDNWTSFLMAVLRITYFDRKSLIAWFMNYYGKIGKTSNFLKILIANFIGLSKIGRFFVYILSL